MATRNINHRLQNLLQTALLIGGMLALAGALGYFMAGLTGLIWAGAFGLGTLVFGRTASPEWLLRFLGARQLRREHAPDLFAMAAELTRRAGLPVIPRIFIVPQPVLNAFAIGSRDDPAIGLTAGLLRNLGPRDIYAILAHEISHIRSNDLRVMTLAAVLGHVTRFLSGFGRLLLFINLPMLLFGRAPFSWPAIFLMLAAPILSILLQQALSRAREFDADLSAVRLTGDPHGLAVALRKLEANQPVNRWGLPYTRMPPPGPFSTHPATTERVARLMELAGAV